jgi:hypothetical protein
MATTKEDISQWFDEGVKKGATHMLVVTDTFDYCPKSGTRQHDDQAG